MACGRTSPGTSRGDPSGDGGLRLTVGTPPAEGGAQSAAKLAIPAPRSTEKWALSESEFAEVGGPRPPPPPWLLHSHDTSLSLPVESGPPQRPPAHGNWRQTVIDLLSFDVGYNCSLCGRCKVSTLNVLSSRF